ncbi:MAG: TonB-dependent receptor [Cyanobacteria bacterium P01_B01_bin.77]
MAANLGQWNFSLRLLRIVGGSVAIAALILPFTPAAIAQDPEASTTRPPLADVLAQAAPTEITGVQLERGEAGLQILLDTAGGELSSPTSSVSGNALIIEVANAILAIPEGDEFIEFEPTDDIAVVQVTSLTGNRVQIAITGSEAPPEVAIDSAATGLILGVTPGIVQADTTDDPLRLVVTGEEGSEYFEPNATTGTRTDTPLRDIPQSIQVIPREVLEDQQVIQLEDALRNVSGVTSSGQDPRGARFNVRGFNDTTVLRDGFRINGTAQNLIPQDLANIEQIEVLKGPAAIVFGAVEPGGAINLVTEQPLSEPAYEVGLRVGSRGLIEPSLDLTGPITEDGRVRYRLNALVRREDYYRDFDTTVNRSFIAPVVSWDISDRTNLTVDFEYIDDQTPGDFGLAAIGDEVADISFERNLGEPDDIVTTEYLRAGYRFEHRFSDNWKVRNAFNFFSRGNQLNNASSVFLNGATGDLTRNFTLFDLQEEFYELQTNLVGEFATGSIEHTLLFGVDLFWKDDAIIARRDFFTNVPLNIFNPVYGQVSRPDFNTLPIIFDGTFQLNLLGIYLQDQISFADNLHLLAGIRYDIFDQERIATSPFLPAPLETTQSESAFSPRVGLVYQPIEDVSLFASYSRSFVPNPATTLGRDLLDPEAGEQFEVGVKAELLDGRLAANLAYFDITLQNVSTPDPVNQGFSIATGEERSRGVELDVAGEILSGWNVIANYAYIDAEITEDNSGLEGNRKFNVPEHNFNLWTTYDIQSGPLEGLGFGLGANYVGERFGDNANSFTVEDYFLTNAAISYQRDNWQARLNFRNLFDVDYIESASGRNSGIFPGRGLMVIGSFSIEF